MGSQTTTAFRRTIRVLCALCLVALVVSVMGCGSGLFGMNTEEDEKLIAEEQARDKTFRDRQAKKSEAEAASGGEDVMQYEEGADPLVGTWTYPEIRVSYPSDSEGNRVGPGTWAERESAQKFTILKQGEGYAMKTGAGGTSKVTFDGTSVTVEYSYPTNSALHSGIIKEDTITGTQHLVAGPDVYDGPWTARRVE